MASSHASDPVCTCFMVRSLSRKISQLYDDTLAPCGLRGTQFSLLVQARNAPDGPLTVSALAERLHTDRTTMTRNLRALQQAGLIELAPGTDARSRCVLVTPEGRSRIREAAALWRQAQQRVRELCGAERIAALESLALGMLPMLETATQEDAA
ncbi:MarR family winged helix-turn-helix transcriptional regulator [Delftia sp. PS-11]|uniref:MarR family winged helix-turn-helix transcriptional regulator n=1 Tax=Delftia sp. PS-11 TaxID=2767222 RepID=UPI0024539043|nr:MarR family transcriptional regulator [Delftia sp. PS-11]KAJ8745998.1 MarR family transcriptional regulator [Delftia sp. PS-11]